MIKHTLGLESELRVGPSGSFEVAVDGNLVAKRGFSGFPTEEEIIDAVKAALPAS